MNPHPRPTLCLTPNCTSPAVAMESAGHYCVAHWASLISHLERKLNFIGDEARCIYIGRSNYPERRALEHFVDRGHDYLTVLHWSGHPDEIVHLESEVIRRCGRRKMQNATEESLGRVRGAWNCLYLSWAAKASPKACILDHVFELEGLAGRRSAPVLAEFPMTPRVFFVRMTHAAAVAAVGVEAERRRFYG